MNEEQSINQPIKGMNRDRYPGSLDGTNAYTDALNARQETEDGSEFFLSNEPSNILGRYFGDYKVIGKLTIPEADKTFYWLTDGTHSEIGYITGDNSGCIDNINKSDPAICTECGDRVDTDPITGEVSELITAPCLDYTKIVNSDCLDFSLDHPILDSTYKITNKSIELYWTDSFHPMMWLDINNIPLLKDGSLDCNSMRIFPEFSVPNIHPVQTEDNGSLKAGSYQFFVAYSNSKGEELSQYYSPTNPTSIWQDKITSDLNFPTDKAIKLEITHLDTRFKFINLAVGKKYAGATTFELIGTFDLVNDTFDYLYTGDNPIPKPLSRNDIYFLSPVYNSASTVASQNNILMWGGLVSDDTINYQDVANRITLKWETNRIPYTKFEGYNEGTNTANYKSHMRGETYAFEISFLKKKSGTWTERCHIPGRTAKQGELDIVSNNDTKNFKQNPCDDPNIVYRWQVYDTSSNDGLAADWGKATDHKCYIGKYESGDFSYHESTEVYPLNKNIWGSLASIPIRHHKFPDTAACPIFTNESSDPNNPEFYIYPIGIKIDNTVVYKAIQNSGLTQEEKDDIIGYQIIRANRSGNKSIIAKGLLFNVGQYQRDSQTFYYPNYNYNDLRKDPFISSSQVADHSGPNDGGDSTIAVRRTASFGIGQDATSSLAILPASEFFYSVKVPIALPGGINSAIYVSLSVSIDDNGNYLVEPAYDNPPEFDPATVTCTTVNIASFTPGDVFMMQIPITIGANPAKYWAIIPFIISGTSDISFDNNITATTPGAYSNVAHVAAENNGGPLFMDTVDLYFTTTLNFAGSFTYDYGNQVVPGVDSRLDAFSDTDISGRRFTMHSPDTSFRHPPLSGYLDIEAVYYGKSTSHIIEVANNPKYTIGTKKCIKIAVVLGLSTLAQYEAGYLKGTITLKLENFIPGFLAGLDLIKKLIPFRQYGYQFNSIGRYTDTIRTIPEGKKIRALDLAGYLDPGLMSIGDDFPINNFQRESSVYLKTTDILPYPQEYGAPEDNSRFTFNSYNSDTGEILQIGEKITRDISSLYGAIKVPIPDQYGQIYSYRTVLTGNIYYLDITNIGIPQPTLFGGDTFINPFGLKRKLPFFLSNTVGAVDDTDILYNELGNVGYPTYYLSTGPVDVDLTDDVLNQFDKAYNAATTTNFGKGALRALSGGLTAYIPLFKAILMLADQIISKLGIKNTNFDAYVDKGYFEEGKMYIFSYGIPYFFVESDINVDYRQAENSTEKDFYPKVGTDIPDFWLQEKNVSIAFDNYYYYNPDFSSLNLDDYLGTIDPDFDPNKDNTHIHSTRVIYSEPTTLEERQNNWLVYKANNYYDFPLTYGKLIDISPLEQQKVLARFENNFSVYNAFISINTDNKTAIVGNDSLFANPPQEYSRTDTGYCGTQHKTIVSTKYGQYWVDAKRGDVVHLSQNGVEEIGRKGIRNWLKENLPFRITKQIPNVPTDNAFKDIGITMGWDNRYERLFITKKDFIPLNKDIVYRDGKFFIDKTTEKEVTFTNYTCPAGSELVAGQCLLPIHITPTEQIINNPVVQKTNATWSVFGCTVYDTYNIDSIGTYSVANTAYWRSKGQPIGSSIAIWTVAPTVNQWVGFDTCLTVTETKVYYVLLAADNFFRFSIDGVLLVAVDNFTKTAALVTEFPMYHFEAPFAPPYQLCHIYPVTLTAGTHKLSLQAEDTGVPGMMMAEIYNNTKSQILAATQDSDLNILFTTKGKTNFDTTIYTCPAGYEIDGSTLCHEPGCLGYQVTEPIGTSRTEVQTETVSQQVNIYDPTYFCDASWTIAYAPQSESWVSYYSFIPDYYVEQQNYFQTGRNFDGNNKSSLWNHLLTNKSYQVFYGSYYPFMVESVTPSSPLDKTLTSIAYRADVLRYTNLYDWKYMSDISFTDAVVYDNKHTSGPLKLAIKGRTDMRNGLLTQINDDSISIPLAQVDDTWRFNKFSDVTSNVNSLKPIMTYDCANVNRKVNMEAVDLKRSIEMARRQRLKSDFFKVRLINNIHSRYKFIYKWILNKDIKSVR